MRIPKMQASPQYRVTIPKLDGGVNLKDAPHLVEDNQLTDVCNMWWQDQALRTRPGLMTDAEKIEKLTLPFNSVGFSSESYHLLGEPMKAIIKIENPISYPRITIELLHSDGTKTQFGNAITINALLTAPNVQLIESGHKTNGCGFYAFVKVNSNVGYVYELSTNHTAWIKLADSEIYAPMVTVNGRGTDSDLYNPESPNGTLLEGYNMLTPAFRAGFTSDGKGSRFVLPQKNLDGSKPISISYIYGDTVPVWTIDANETESNVLTLNFSEDASAACEVKFTASKENGTIQTWIRENAETNPGPWQKKPLPSNGINNDIIVTAFGQQTTDKARIFGMKFGTWFGGDRSGINGGTRYFVSGNSSHKNLVHWSDTNNPLYFPENNYAYVGESNQSVTAFAKQENMLVIFKERELYYATYVSGGDFTAQDVIDGKIIDVAANMAKFPITQIHANIGCDCPGTIQLCDNRLVWASSSRKVYVLCSASQYSERNILDVSGPVESVLAGWSNTKGLVSCDWQGHYLLINGNMESGKKNSVLVLNYKDNAFAQIGSYADPKKISRRLLWYIWDFSNQETGFIHALSDGQDCVLIGRRRVVPEETSIPEDWIIRYVLAGDADSKTTNFVLDGTNPIQSMFQTKLFDFGRPERRKNVRKLHIGATDVVDGYITLSYVTEFGKQEDAYRIGMYGDGDMRVWAVTPHVNRIRRFGIRADSAGAMAVDGMVIRYEVYGEVR